MQAFTRIATTTGISTLLCLLLLPASTAHAAGNSACRQDRDKFCKDVKNGQGRIRECLQSHLDELSPACREHVEAKAKATPRAGKRMIPRRLKGCEAELDKFCKDVKPGGGRYVDCLKEHEADLSDACKKSLEGMSRHGAWRKAPGGGPAGGNAQGSGAAKE